MLQVGQFWMPIRAKGGSLLHAVLHMGGLLMQARGQHRVDMAGSPIVANLIMSGLQWIFHTTRISGPWMRERH